MDNYIKNLAYAISNGSMENTYKMAWIRSLVDFSIFNPNKKQVLFNDLSKYIFGYYWNQTIFFKLEQGPNLNKRPKIHQMVINAIDRFQKTNGYKPIYFEKAEKRIEFNLEEISGVLSENVCWRFPKVDEREFDFYKLDLENHKLELHRPDLLNEYSEILYELINYRWTQKLEELNTSPRIAQKVRGTGRGKIKRKPLRKYKEYLDLTNPKRISFISGNPIREPDLSIDHVIPWSYLYSDDLWNLVYVDKGENSSKSNRIPNEKMIRKLEDRNKKLLREMTIKGVTGKVANEFRLAIDNNYVEKFWVSFKG